MSVFNRSDDSNKTCQISISEPQCYVNLNFYSENVAAELHDMLALLCINIKFCTTSIVISTYELILIYLYQEHKVTVVARSSEMVPLTPVKDWSSQILC